MVKCYTGPAVYKRAIAIRLLVAAQTGSTKSENKIVMLISIVCI